MDSNKSQPPSQPESDITQTDFWQFFQRIWAELRASGHVPRSKEEIDAELEASREEYEEQMLAIERIQEECEQHRRERLKFDPGASGDSGRA